MSQKQVTAAVSESWLARMATLSPLVMTGEIKILWRLTLLGKYYLPFVVLRSGLELKMSDPIVFPTNEDVAQIMLAVKAGQ